MYIYLNARMHAYLHADVAKRNPSARPSIAIPGNLQATCRRAFLHVLCSTFAMQHTEQEHAVLCHGV